MGVWFAGAPVKWKQGIDGKDQVAGILDTGVDPTHPDLLYCPDGSPKFLGERDYTGDTCNPGEYHWHGTHVAGTVVANGKVKGMAPGARFRSYRVLDRNGNGGDAGIIQAIYDGVADGCHVLNLSLGSKEYSRGIHEAVKHAVSQGVPVVVAAGNDGPNSLNYPGYLQEVIAVGAIGIFANGRIQWQWFSSTNDEVDVSANGIDVLSTVPGGLYKLAMGTSMAAPHVAGQMLLNRQQHILRTGEVPAEPVQWYGLKGLQTVDVEAAGIDARTGAGFATFYPALPLRKQVAMTTNVPQLMVDGVAKPLDVGPVMVPVPGTDPLQHRTYTPPRHTHEAVFDHVGWEEGPKDAQGKPTGTATISRWLIPGMEDGQPIGRI